ncbi:sperm flagellar protein 1-like isoform X1 [Neofelis nebulosa]|uniref:sperm flagellar protein 1-like isoform X1 n=1 Tax=Neofelis nebulosa TaxID=61452 RepID=UPI00272D7B95|nr:sperm flagellar protein 1-like isoform X1 [Neofelis nebulosa]
MNTGNGKRQNPTFSPTQTLAGSPPPPAYRLGGVAGDPHGPPLPAPGPSWAPSPGNRPNSRSRGHAGRSGADPAGFATAAAALRPPRPLRLAGRAPAQPSQAPPGPGLQRRRKVFHKLRLWVSETDIRKVVANTPGAIEPILCALREKVTDGAAHQYLLDPAGPGPSGGIADRPQAELTASLHTGLPGPVAPSSAKTPQSPRTPEKTGRCVCTGWDPAGGPWGHLDSRVQQLLEEKEQALALLQEMVKILQMKVVRLEHLVKLKDQRIGELTRAAGEPQ